MIADNLYNSSQEAINRIELICGKRPEFFKVDVTEEGSFDAVFEKHPDIDSVIHFAALKVGRSHEDTDRKHTIPNPRFILRSHGDMS